MSFTKKHISAALVLAVFACAGPAFAMQDQSQDNQPKQTKDKSSHQKSAKQKDKKKEATAEAASNLPAVLWRDPGNISQLDMVNGAGGPADAPDPKADYTFEKEDMNGTQTKFYVKDSNGVEWLAKVGPEARPETAATRILWAMGYTTDEDYFVPSIHVNNLPVLRRKMHGASTETGIVPDVRLKRQDKETKKAGNWSWFDNPFEETREFDGLRVLVALVNDWDLKESNNKIYVTGDKREFVVSDLGGTFGRTNMPFISRGNLGEYEHSKFIKRRDGDTVSFVMKTRALFIFWPFDLWQIPEYSRMEWIPEKIPVEHAR